MKAFAMCTLALSVWTVASLERFQGKNLKRMGKRMMIPRRWWNLVTIMRMRWDEEGSPFLGISFQSHTLLESFTRPRVFPFALRGKFFGSGAPTITCFQYSWVP